MAYLKGQAGRVTAKTLDSPVLTTPALGTPASGVMTNMTGAVEASLVDNAVTLAKMDGLARGKLIIGDASGNPSALAVGSADQVLTHDGTDLTWEDAASGGTDPDGAQIFNDSSNDVDFRIESDNMTHAFFVQGSDGKIGMNEDTPAYQLHVKRTAIASDGVCTLEHTYVTGYAAISHKISDGNAFDYGVGGPSESNVGSQFYWHKSGHLMKLNTSGVLWVSSSYTQGSDIKLKKDIVDISYGLSAVLQLQPRAFKWKRDDSSAIGFVAQEIENVIPEVVLGEDLDEYVPNDGDKTVAEASAQGKSVNYPVLTSVLCKAVQELDAKNTALTARVTTLEG